MIIFWENFDNNVTSVLHVKTPWQAILKFNEHPEVQIDVHYFTEDNLIELKLRYKRKAHLKPFIKDNAVYTQYVEEHNECVRYTMYDYDLNAVSDKKAYLESTCTNMYNDYIDVCERAKIYDEDFQRLQFDLSNDSNIDTLNEVANWIIDHVNNKQSEDKNTDMDMLI